MNPQPGDVLEFDNSITRLLVLIVRRYPVMLGTRSAEEVEVLWLMGHAQTAASTSKHCCHPDTWDGWRRL